MAIRDHLHKILERNEAALAGMLIIRSRHAVLAMLAFCMASVILAHFLQYIGYTQVPAHLGDLCKMPVGKQVGYLSAINICADRS